MKNICLIEDEENIVELVKLNLEIEGFKVKSFQNGMRAKWANELFIMTSGDKKVSISKGNKHGSYILKENKQLATDVINWFNKTL